MGKNISSFFGARHFFSIKLYLRRTLAPLVFLFVFFCVLIVLMKAVMKLLVLH